MSYVHNKRWRATHTEARNQAKARNYARGSTGRRRPWTTEEDRLVLEHACTDRELSFRIDRSVRAIHVRRNRLRGS